MMYVGQQIVHGAPLGKCKVETKTEVVSLRASSEEDLGGQGTIKAKNLIRNRDMTVQPVRIGPLWPSLAFLMFVCIFASRQG